MKLLKLTPELMVKDVNETVKFYSDILGFKLINNVGKDKMIWAKVMLNEAALMFMEKNTLGEDIKSFKNIDIGGSVVQFIELEGIEELYEKIKNKTEIVQDIHKTDYGTKEFSIKDINGYMLAFAERIK